MQTGFSFTKMLVSDLAASVQFYTQTMGLTVAYQFESGEGADKLEEAILSHSGSGYDGRHNLVLIHYPNRPRAVPGEAIFGFTVADAQGTVEAVLAAGGALARPVRTLEEHGIKVGFVTDPEGHLLEIVEMTATAAASPPPGA